MTNTVEPAEAWEPTNKTITIKAATHQRLQRYFTHYGSTFDSVITQILDEKDKREIPTEERSFFRYD